MRTRNIVDSGDKLRTDNSNVDNIFKVRSNNDVNNQDRNFDNNNANDE